MSKDTQFYTHKTLASWDEAAALHAKINQHLIHDVQDPSFNHLDDALNGLLDVSNIKGKSVVQICCNNGIDLLSVKGWPPPMGSFAYSFNKNKTCFAMSVLW